MFKTSLDKLYMDLVGIWEVSNGFGHILSVLSDAFDMNSILTGTLTVFQQVIFHQSFKRFKLQFAETDLDKL